MLNAANTKQKPDIVISDADYSRLTRLAEGLLDRLPDVAGELLAEVERARVVPAAAFPGNAVAMGSTVEYRTEEGTSHRATLVYPDEADITEGRVSILTPVGAALIGLSEGQSISWLTRDGRTRRLSIMRVTPPRESRPAQAPGENP
ncbi:MAG TPA: nucleoside diphosphate kinase regulator [Hyphomicrobiaceae bacterium]|jgi:regulator of nucleoside diphosphate kinase|nr:nucleoside diphosphate kinase regulator [Hyphomicrobiaceae bacterium]